MSAFDGAEAQLARLDLQEGDIVTVRTRSKLDADKANRWQDGLEKLVRAQGWRNVGVLILDDCTDIAVDRPATRLVQQRRDVPQPMQGC